MEEADPWLFPVLARLKDGHPCEKRFIFVAAMLYLRVAF